MEAAAAFPLLSADQERVLAARARAGDQGSRNRLVEANLRLVVACARQYERKDIPLMDLVQEGNLGLLEAATRFDPDRGTRFSTYAVWWVEKFVLAALRRSPDAISLDDVLQDRPGVHGALVGSSGDQTQLVEQDEVSVELFAHLATLGQRERRILELRFGLGDTRPHTLRQVGRKLGITFQAVQQIERRALATLRAMMTPDDAR